MSGDGAESPERTTVPLGMTRARPCSRFVKKCTKRIVHALCGGPGAGTTRISPSMSSRRSSGSKMPSSDIRMYSSTLKRLWVGGLSMAICITPRDGEAPQLPRRCREFTARCCSAARSMLRPFSAFSACASAPVRGGRCGLRCGFDVIADRRQRAAAHRRVEHLRVASVDFGYGQRDRAFRRAVGAGVKDQHVAGFASLRRSTIASGGVT